MSSELITWEFGRGFPKMKGPFSGVIGVLQGIYEDLSGLPFPRI